MPDDPNELGADLAAEVEQLSEELDRPKHADAAAKLAWLVDILVLRGHLSENHKPMVARIRARKPQVRFGHPANAPDPDIDCASLLHLCHARCCSLTVALTEDEIRAGKVGWDLHEPYTLVKDATTGYCANLACGGGCKIYNDRPGTCRKYDCREDARVWLDWETKIPAPMADDVIPLGTWPDDQ
ncbi:MAG: YkgJ family cysteine cluster protein [Kofleriaceae bacterium]